MPRPSAKPFPSARQPWIAAGLLWLLAASDPSAAGHLRRQGRQIVDDDGPVLLRGFNVGNWLVQEGYLMHIDTAGFKSPTELRAKVADLVGGAAKADEFFSEWRNSFFAEADVAALKAAGGNSFRIPFHYKDVFDPVARRAVPAGFRWLDSCVAWGRRHQVHMILDMHVAPGGQNPMEHSDVPAEPGRLFAGSAAEFEQYSRLTAEAWKAVADRYKAEPNVAYDLINEPLVEDPAQHWKLQQAFRRITDSIRTVDKTHLIIAEGNWWGSWLQPLGARWDGNMAFSTHNYWNKAPDVKRSGQIDWSVQQDVPIWHGETGENSGTWYNLERRDLEAKGIGWSFWTWKKIEGISGAYTTTATPGGYQSVLRFWRGQGERPDPENALQGLMDLAVSTRLEVCRKNHDVFDALFRADFHLKGVPYAGILKDVPEEGSESTRLRAAEYDMGAQGVAYSDSAFMTESMHKDSAVHWNQGWSWRNGGVDVYMDWSAWEPFVGGTSPGEWIDFTVNVVREGRYRIDFNASTPEAGRKIRVSVDGNPIGSDVQIPVTGGWTDWTEVTGPVASLKAGRQTLRVAFPVGSQNLRAVSLVSLEPAWARARRRSALSISALAPAPGGAWIRIASPAEGTATMEEYSLDGARTARWTLALKPGAHRHFLPGAGTGLRALALTSGTERVVRMVMR